MRRLLFMATALLSGCNASLAQVSTLGTTTMGLSSTPGTIVTCSTPTGQIAPGTPAVPVTSMSATGGTTGTTPSTSAAPTASAVPASSSTSTTGTVTAPFLTLSAQPATSFMTDFPGSNIP